MKRRGTDIAIVNPELTRQIACWMVLCHLAWPVRKEAAQLLFWLQPPQDPDFHSTALHALHALHACIACYMYISPIHEVNSVNPYMPLHFNLHTLLSNWGGE